MATSIIPPLVDALVSLADAALDSVTVYDGFGVSDDPGDFLMVGVEDPDNDGATASAESSQAPATMGTGRSRDETGSISCVALSWNGDGDQKAARDAAFATVNAVAGLCRTNPSLGVFAASNGLVVTSFGPSQTLRQNQDEDGAAAAVFFTVGFRARL